MACGGRSSCCALLLSVIIVRRRVLDLTLDRLAAAHAYACRA